MNQILNTTPPNDDNNNKNNNNINTNKINDITQNPFNNDNLNNFNLNNDNFMQNGVGQNDGNDINLNPNIQNQSDLLNDSNISNNLNSSNNIKKQNKKSLTPQALEVESIIRYFAIFILIFGLLSSLFGGYSFAKIKEDEDKKMAKPQIQIIDDDISDNTLILNISSKYPIDTVTYIWDNENVNKLSGNGRCELSETIKVENGEHNLYVKAESSNGNITEISQDILRDANIKIDFTDSNSEIVVNVESKNGISYLTYRWNNDEEEKMEFEDDNDNVEFSLDVPNGTNFLTVVVVDNNNEQEESVIELTGIDEVKDTGDGPDLKLEFSDSEININGYSDNGIKQVEIIYEMPKEDKILDVIDDSNEYEKSYPLEKGYNKITVRIFDNDDNVTIKKIEGQRGEHISS